MITYEQEMALKAIENGKIALDNASLKQYCKGYYERSKLDDTITFLRTLEDRILKEAREGSKQTFDPDKRWRG